MPSFASAHFFQLFANLACPGANSNLNLSSNRRQWLAVERPTAALVRKEFITMRIAVTGAFGYSGRYITKRLLDAGHEAITLTNSVHRPNPFGKK